MFISEEPGDSLLFADGYPWNQYLLPVVDFDASRHTTFPREAKLNSRFLVTVAGTIAGVYLSVGNIFYSRIVNPCITDAKDWIILQGDLKTQTGQSSTDISATLSLKADKTYTDTQLASKAELSDIFAVYRTLGMQQMLTGGGTITWSGTTLKWTSEIAALPVNNGAVNYVSINCPSSGTVKYYYASGIITKTVTIDGIPLGSWEALYFVPETSDISFSQSEFAIVSYQYGANPADKNWILIAAQNNDDSSLKWLPGQINIPQNGTYISATGVGSWTTTASTVDFVALFNAGLTA